MFIAMNRFQVTEGRGADFEELWRSRDSYLKQVPGFRHFQLLRGDTAGEYISHSTWESRAAFEAWAQSDEFRRAHGSRPSEGVLAEHPRVSFYEVVLSESAEAEAQAV